MSDEATFTKAIAFAAKAHEGQVRKGSGAPYILHSLEAAAVCATFTQDYDVLMAAVLHDVVEDTNTTIEEVRREFGQRVASIVAGESENKREGRSAGETWEERKKESLDYLATTQDSAVLAVCMGDKLSNIRAMARDVADYGDALWSRFNQKDPAKHAWYYASLASIIEPSFGHTHAWREYNNLLQETFGSYLT